MPLVWPLRGLEMGDVRDSKEGAMVAGISVILAIVGRRGERERWRVLDDGWRESWRFYR